MAHPPGRETSHSPNLVRRGPKTKIEALIWETISYTALVELIEALLMCATVSVCSTSAPNMLRSLSRVRMSTTLGRFVKVTVLSLNIVAAIIGSAAFFDPLIVILPLKVLPPMISK